MYLQRSCNEQAKLHNSICQKSACAIRLCSRQLRHGGFDPLLHFLIDLRGFFATGLYRRAVFSFPRSCVGMHTLR